MRAAALNPIREINRNGPEGTQKILHYCRGLASVYPHILKRAKQHAPVISARLYSLKGPFCNLFDVFKTDSIPEHLKKMNHGQAPVIILLYKAQDNRAFFLIVP